MSEQRVPYGCDAEFVSDGTFEAYRHSTTVEFEFGENDLMIQANASTLNGDGPCASSRIFAKIPYTSDAFKRIGESFKNFQKGKK